MHSICGNQHKGISLFWEEICLKAPSNLRMFFTEDFNEKRNWWIIKRIRNPLKDMFFVACSDKDSIHLFFILFYFFPEMEINGWKEKRVLQHFLEEHIFSYLYIFLLITLTIHFSHESDADHISRILHSHQMNATLQTVTQTITFQFILWSSIAYSRISIPNINTVSMLVVFILNITNIIIWDISTYKR